MEMTFQEPIRPASAKEMLAQQMDTVYLVDKVFNRVEQYWGWVVVAYDSDTAHPRMVISSKQGVSYEQMAGVRDAIKSGLRLDPGLWDRATWNNDG